MIFIFDWGHTTTKKIGPVAMSDLEIGGSADSYAYVVRHTSWFRLFFIPMIPTKRWYSIQNEKTSEHLMVNDIEKWLPLAKLNQLAVDNKITAEEFDRRRSEIVP